VKLVGIIFLLMTSGFLFGQSTCSLAKEVYVQELSNISLNQGIQFFKIKKDSSFFSVNLQGNFNKITVYQTDSCAKMVVKSVLNSVGVYQPSPSQIDQGYCFCETCIDRLSQIKLSETESILIKIEGGTSVESTLTEIPVVKSNNWYDKDYNKGDRIKLTNIMFIAGTANFQRASYDDLDLLYNLLKIKSKLRIEIQGHVNGPRLNNKKEFQQLSEARAKAVLEYLVTKGTSKKRLTSVGYGNTKMIFPTAESEFRMQFNRRVEILVL